MPKLNIPSYRLHKPSGQAIVVLDGKTFYLGKYKSKASRIDYENRIAEYLGNGRKLPPIRSNHEITCQELAVRFLEWAESYYVKNGKLTGTLNHVQMSLAPFVQHYGKNPVSEFSPLSLEFLRDKWLASGSKPGSKLKRPTINRYISIIKQCFKWGVAHELVDANTWHALTAVDNLKAGRTPAEEYRKVKSVPAEIVEKTLPFLRPIVADMVRVQLLGGMRPQDVRHIRACDIDRRGEIWKYTPFTHKTEHHGKERIIAIGYRAQAILTPYLIEKADDPEAFLFSPKDTVKLQNIDKRRKRRFFNKRGEVQPSQRNRSKPNPRRPAGNQYTKGAYERALKRACEKAGTHWTLNQLRHSKATEISDRFGKEAAQMVLGHTNASTTDIYIDEKREENFEKAAKVAREIG